MLYLRAKSSMNTEDPLTDDCCDREVIECIRYDFPCSQSESSFTLIEKSIEFIELAGLMIASEQKKSLWMFDFIGKQKKYTLE